MSLEPGLKKQSLPIAQVVGGDYDKETLYLVNDDESNVRGGVKPELNILEAEKALSKKKMALKEKQAELLRMKEAFAIGVEPHDYMGAGKEAYVLAIKTKEKRNNKAIELPPGSSFSLVVPPEGRFIWYIAGPSGSGKSYVCKGLAENYRKQFPDRPVYLVSLLKQDETLDSMKGGMPIRLNIKKLVESPLEDLEPLRNSLVIFDDYDTIQGAEGKAVYKLLDDIAIMGRHTFTSMVCISHYLTNYKKSRIILTEATHYVIYPGATGRQALTYFLKTYVGMDEKEAIDLKHCGSRWVCIHKNFPMWCVTEFSANLLHLN